MGREQSEYTCQSPHPHVTDTCQKAPLKTYQQLFLIRLLQLQMCFASEKLLPQGRGQLCCLQTCTVPGLHLCREHSSSACVLRRCSSQAGWEGGREWQVPVCMDPAHWAAPVVCQQVGATLAVVHCIVLYKICPCDLWNRVRGCLKSTGGIDA